MDVNLTVQDKSGKTYVYQTFDNMEFFKSAVEKTYERRNHFGKLSDSDRVVSIFSKGATVKKEDFAVLKRALRHYDEVYLCNEIFEAIEEMPKDVVYLSLGNIENSVDLSFFNI